MVLRCTDVGDVGQRTIACDMANSKAGTAVTVRLWVMVVQGCLGKPVFGEIREVTSHEFVDAVDKEDPRVKVVSGTSVKIKMNK
jgi:hypothetical protein